MKRPIFIIIGVLLVFILLGIWVYILIFGAPKNSADIFANLNFGDTTDVSVPTEEPIEETPVVTSNEQKKLRQLTTKPVIGYQEIKTSASSSPEVLYIEAGTGNIFSINLVSGEEKKVSVTTTPLSTAGAITPNGKFVLLQSGSGLSSEFTIGEFSSTSDKLEISILDEQIIDFKSTDENTFLYAVKTDNSVVAKEYNPVKAISKTLFTIPFREVSIDWGDKASDTHYVYPKTSNRLEGFLYQTNGSKVKRLPIDGYGLSANGSSDFILYSKQVNDKYETYVYETEKSLSTRTSGGIIPEKCASLHQETTKAICGKKLTPYDETTPDSWYQGTADYVDNIYEIDIDTNPISTTFLSDTMKEVSRELDMIRPAINMLDTNFYFINKNDGTLWVYNFVSPSAE
jgi:flagellar basal body-associated protein FliL